MVTHCTHRDLALQIGVEVPAHSVFVKHCTQVAVSGLHLGAAAEHCASDEQPTTHFNSFQSHDGAEAPQSALERHCTQAPSLTLHHGWEAGQSEF